MNLEDAFLQDIAEHPDDLAPRLIYADWLDDQGRDRRAEFIRVQIAREKSPTDDLTRRETELLRAEAAEWLGPLAPCLRDYRFKNGMLDYVRIDAETLADRYESLLRLGPVPRLGVVVPPGDRQALIRLTRCPIVRRLRSLTVEGTLGPAELLVLGQGLPFERLQMLDLSGNPVGADGVTALMQSPLLKQVWLLSLRNTALGVNGIERLARAAPEKLVSLNVAGNRLGNTGMQMLAGSRRLSSLNFLDFADNDLGPTGVRALVAASWSKSLQRLDLSNNPVGCDGLEALCARGGPPELYTLHLMQTRQTFSSGGLLAKAPFLGKLRYLDLGGNALTTRGVADLVGMTPPKMVIPLVSLNLAGNEIGDEGAKLLAGWRAAASVRRLCLDGNGLRAFGLRPLVDSPHLGCVEKLSLRNNRLGLYGAQILARWQGLSRLHELDVANNGIDDAGLVELLKSPHWRPFAEADLTRNDAGDEAHRMFESVVGRFGSLRL